MDNFDQLVEAAKQHFLAHERNEINLPLHAEAAVKAVLADATFSEPDVYGIMLGAAEHFQEMSEDEPGS